MGTIICRHKIRKKSIFSGEVKKNCAYIAVATLYEWISIKNIVFSMDNLH